MTPLIPMKLSIGNIQVRRGAREIVHFSPTDRLEVDAGEIVCLLGPSGCGKSTILDAVAGFVPVAFGSIDRDGQVGYLMQSRDAFPWLTVAQNLALSGRACPTKVPLLVDRTGLESVLALFPGQLSGGLRKRLAFARLLLEGASIWLMDEPFSAIDLARKLDLWTMVESMVTENRVAALIVTHDPYEAVRLADRIIGLRGSPAHIAWSIDVRLSRPRNDEVLASSGAAELIHRIITQSRNQSVP